MKKYWKSFEELQTLQSSENEKVQPEPEFSVEGLTQEEISNKLKTNRRDFLKFLGFSVGTAALAASCENPVRKAIPYLNQPEEIIPGQAIHYASTFYDGHDFCPVVVKVRDGRPIKIEGNELSPLTEGGTSARVQASVLGLYDSARLQHPLKKGEKTNWQTLDEEVREKLAAIAGQGGKIAILTAPVVSPSFNEVLRAFEAQYPGTEIIPYDAVSYSAMREANLATFGKDVIPSYHFDRAEVIAAFNADFLAGWLSPVEFAAQYAKTREISEERKTMSKHYQFESWMSLTGSNADVRVTMKPHEELIILLNLYNKIAAKSGMPGYDVSESPVDLDELVADLMEHQGRGLVVSGTNDVYIQALVNGINFLLGNLGGTFDFERVFNGRNSNDQAVASLFNRMKAGEIDAVIFNDVNPAYDYHDPELVKAALENTGLKVSLALYNDETARNCDYVAAVNHYLESWGDYELYTGHYSLAQPAIRNLFDTRQAEASMMSWCGLGNDYHAYIMKYWENNLFPNQNKYLTFTEFWNHTLQDGIYIEEVPVATCPVYDFSFLEANAASLKPEKPEGIELVLYEKAGIGVGKQANNPWLQELPDPISKAVWDNYVAMSPEMAAGLGVTQEDVVEINGSYRLPVLYQPGQPKGTVSIAVGYGREGIGKVADGKGVNVFQLMNLKNGYRCLAGTTVTITPTGETYPLATTQTHHSMEGRPIVRETVLEKWLHDPASGNELHKINQEKATTLYKYPEYEGFHWGLAVDLNKCIGCSACVIACQAENNIPVIGKEEVKNKRIMHWIRIDRYYALKDQERSSVNSIYRVDSENPEVVHQPVMCQHCDNAPCENVCPVAATPHSKEGLNQMAYNRCIGTRYCMNNCPYRVRRFNWYRFVDNDKFDYVMNDELSRMVLNPDVTVRERGVVEKCTFCVQRIQEKKLDAKKENRMVVDGDIKTACEQACPTKALVFGDMNNSDSRVARLKADPRRYNLLEELHTLSSVNYLTKVRNRPADGETAEEGHHA